MIPLNLLLGLEERMKKVFADSHYNRPPKNDEEDDQLSNINIYTQQLPVKESEDDSPFPFILIKLQNGSQANTSADHLVSVNIVVGMYDGENNNQGDRDVSLGINKIFKSLSKDPVIGGVFPLHEDSEIGWSISDEETAPYFFGALGATFVAPKFEREDLEGLI